MNAIFRMVMVVAWLIGGFAMGREPLQWAGLRVANALGHGGGLLVRLDGKLWAAEAMEMGEVSSLRRLAPGRHRLQLSSVGFEGLELNLDLKPGQSLTLLAHVGREPQTAEVFIAAYMLESVQVGTGRMATVLDLGLAQRRLLEIRQYGKSWETLALRRMEAQRFAIVQHRGYLPLIVQGRKLPSMPVFEHGHHVLVLFEDAAGQVRSLSYRDRSWPVAEDSSP